MLHHPKRWEANITQKMGMLEIVEIVDASWNAQFSAQHAEIFWKHPCQDKDHAVLLGHFWYTNFWFPDPPPPPSNTSLPGRL